MGVLTDDMTRLRNEVTAMRSERQALLRELQRNTADLMDGFRKARCKMAEETRAELEKAVKDLQETVGGLRKEFAADIQGARRAWAGQGPSSRASGGRRSQGKGGARGAKSKSGTKAKG